MKVTRFLATLVVLLVSLYSVASALDEKKYNYIDAQTAAELIRQNAKIVILDIQEKDDFDKEHLKGALPTYAYPVKTDAQKASIEAVLAKITPEDKVIVVCPRGGGGADKTYDFLLEKGLSKAQIVTLKNGQKGWPRDEIKDVLVK